MLKSKEKFSYTLGLWEAPEGLRGALVRRGTSHEVVRLFDDGRPVPSRDGDSPPQDDSMGAYDNDASSAWAGMAVGFDAPNGGDGGGSSRFSDTASALGYSLDVGGDGAGQDIFLASEFHTSGEPILETVAPPGVVDLRQDLRAMLGQCCDAGAERLDVVWCLDPRHFSFSEVCTGGVSVKDRLTRNRRSRGPTSDVAVRLRLADSDEETVRHLLLQPRHGEPSSKAMAALRSSNEELVAHCITDTEVTALYALERVRRKQSPATGSSFVVRVGEDDVLVLIVHQDGLHGVEVLRSLSLHDGSDVLRRRILLLMDDHGPADLENIYLVAPDDASGYVEAFASYFNSVRVSQLAEDIPGLESYLGRMPHGLIQAVGAAMRDVVGLDVDENLLRPGLRRPRRISPYRWHVWFLFALLAGTAVFFAARFAEYSAEIAQRERRIDALTHDGQTAPLLRQRIDSLRTTYSVNVQGLAVMDSLLVGSDRWSRSLDRVVGEIAAIGDLWIETWTPAGPIVDVVGLSTSRDNVVELTRRIGGTIEEITYPDETSDLYRFRLTLPLAYDLPEAVSYLRARAKAAVPGPAGAHVHPAAVSVDETAGPDQNH